MTTLADRGQIFKGYNQLKRDGAERGRLNRALGLAQARKERPYVTTATTCNCPDATFRGNVCKHILSVRMQQSAPAAKSVVDQVNEELFA